MAKKATAGPGRKSTYSEAMDSPIAVRFNDEQAEAVDRWCRKHGISPSSLVREAAVEAVDARLTRGTPSTGWGKKDTERFVASSLPVRFTLKQSTAVKARCERLEVKVATFVREKTLAKIGAKNLGVTRGLA